MRMKQQQQPYQLVLFSVTVVTRLQGFYSEDIMSSRVFPGLSAQITSY